ncbi:putative membrane protein YeiB [Ewingella americana]
MTKPSGMRPRIATLDFARGIAILGILLLNISAFGLPKAAYLNPAFNGQLSSSDAWTWAVLDLVAQGKFLMMFAILFGGGLYLLLPRGKHWIQGRGCHCYCFAACYMRRSFGMATSCSPTV